MKPISVIAVLFVAATLGGCRRGSVQPPQTATPSPAAAPTPTDDHDPSDEQAAVPPVRSVEALRALLPSNGTGCAPGARCIRVTAAGRPSNSGMSIAQCRGEFADFIVPRTTIPASYTGPWFQPNLIEQAHTGVPSGTRPWRNRDPRVENQRLAYLLTLRNYAFASAPVRSLTPQLTSDSDYFDPAGASVPSAQRSQKWYPAPRMIYGPTNEPGSREAAHGMTLERTVGPKELGENTVPFRNYAVAYYDARGARTYARTWSTSAAGVDAPVRANMRMAAGSLVYKLLFSAAKPTDFPQDLLQGSLALNILPNPNSPPLSVRLLQIDIAVKDNRAGATGWYFATYAFDRTVPGTSPWLKMVPVGLMWGNDPGGPPLQESWINPSAPAYAKAHLGVDGRLNGPVDNRSSACMSCHATAQAPAVANMIPPPACASQRANWFRNLAGTQAFGRFQAVSGTCETSLQGMTVTAADYSLQLASTVSEALTEARFNPCTWDDVHPPAPTPSLQRTAERTPVRVFKVTRDPEGQ